MREQTKLRPWHISINRLAWRRRVKVNESVGGLTASDCKFDALVCLVDTERDALFFSIAERNASEVAEEEGDSDDTGNLWNHSVLVTVRLRLTDIDNQDFTSMGAKELLEISVSCS